ncbi:MAG: hypothetical protein ACRDP6_32500 [Actinoallomurus sp.]
MLRRRTARPATLQHPAGQHARGLPPPLFGLAFVLVNAHGGAGSTTLCRLLDPEGTGRVVAYRQGTAAPAGHYPVLVVRTTATGMRSAAWMLQAWRPDVQRPALIVVGDVPFRPPLAVRYRLRAISGQVTGVIEVPYLSVLRGVTDPLRVAEQRSVAAAVAHLRRELKSLAGT